MNAAILGQVGVTVAVPIALGAWLGQKLDERLGTAPWGLLTLTFAGMAVAGIGIALLIRRYSEEDRAASVSEAARKAGRRWEAELEEREREREKQD
ncbi:MAG: AtpZ/AtpI family protein [Chloroflexota bacterium]|nr:AtpZ/AtpI family protein [Chloroflexota bacterium]MDE3192785.1 AtpZ/AtpI family protein [Chloroflexota bacterium]